MKKIIVLSIAAFGFNALFAQAQKAELTAQIKESYTHMQSTAFDNMVTLNLSSTLWDELLDGNKTFSGKKHFAGLGTSLVAGLDYLNGSKLINKCDGNAYPSAETKSDCEKEIAANKNKLTITINAQKIKYTDKSYHLLTGYTNVLDNFISKDRGNYGFPMGWKPKAKELHFILELSETVKDVVVKWSTDGKTATITAPAFIEVDEWDRKIARGLERGGISKN